MKEMRSASQILFGFLPEQTVDLAGRVWKVREWRSPIRKFVDDSALRQELVRLAMPWAAVQLDNDYVRHLRQNRPVLVYSLDRRNGVSTEPFPDVWMCKRCRRVYNAQPNACAPECGGRQFGQLPFVGYHECGAIYAPRLPSCPQHRQAQVTFPGTAAAIEIIFRCPVQGCGRELQRGFGFSRCRCGGGALRFNVHRASPVYTPRTVVVVNPPSPERVKRLNDAGGPLRALSWMLDSVAVRRFDEVGMTRDGLLQDLRSKGFSEAVARAMVDAAEKAGEVAAQEEEIALPQERRDEAARQAVTIAMAIDQSRNRIDDLIAGTADAWGERANMYRHHYPLALQQARLQAVELVEKFPVLTGNFAYTRGGANPAQGSLVPFRIRNDYVVYADIAETEAMFVRLSPTVVARWLQRRGFQLDPWDSDKSARLAIIRAASIPDAGDDPPNPATVGSSVLTLVHSFAHRLIRRAAVFAGIDRNALSELVVPYHLAFFVYAAARGDFVLGGLQAVFESELHNLVDDFVDGDPRCPLDPGCRHTGGACMACLHVGEPSCRYYNRYLDRGTLFGDQGYLTFDL